MPIPDERLNQADELIDEESNSMESAAQEPIGDHEEGEELEFETADIDENDEVVEDDDAVDRDTASFGFGDPAD